MPFACRPNDVRIYIRLQSQPDVFVRDADCETDAHASEYRRAVAIDSEFSMDTASRGGVVFAGAGK